MTWGIYILAGVLWGIFSVKMQRVLFGKYTSIQVYIAIFAVNMCLWPLTMCWDIFAAPLPTPKNEEPNPNLPRYVR